MRRQAALILTAFFGLGTASSIAQITTGSISGTVRDSNGAVQSGAGVEIRNEDWAVVRAAKTNSAGRYSAPLLEPGRYRVTVTQAGFQKVVWRGIVVSAGRSSAVDVELTAGDASQTVQIDSDAPPVDASAGSEVKRADQRAIRDLPTNRSVDSMARLLPGVIQSPPGTGSSFEFGVGARFSDGGARGYGNAFLLDGTSINDHANGTPGNTAGRNPGMESVSGVAVLNGGAAEAGSASGAIVSAVTRSGGNQLH